MNHDPGFDVPLTPEQTEILLGRPEADVHLSQTDPMKILVTGAGGSIGRSLTRALLAAGHEVTALDKNEKGLFLLQQSCAEESAAQPVYVVQDLGDYMRVTQTLATGNFDAVIHAAAHKHVGMMELNAEECRRNNLEHSLNLFQQANRHGVKRFFFLSTDKAVEPVGVMGQSKAEAEKHLAHFAGSSDLKLTTIRLPNVLGSDGSVTQIFRRQLLLGRPLTITDPAATRIFISTTQADQIILAALASEHEGIVVPAESQIISVADLAARANQVWGRSEDLETIVIGLGQGERLHEKLLAADEISTDQPGSPLALIRKAD